MKHRWVTAISIIFLSVCTATSVTFTADGSRKSLSVIVDTTADRSDEAQAVAEYLRAVGVSAEVRVWE